MQKQKAIRILLPPTLCAELCEVSAAMNEPGMLPEAEAL
jgi:hypothetical protein